MRADCSFGSDATIRLQEAAVVVENSNVRVENVAIEFENDSRLVAQQNPLWMTRFELPGGWQEQLGASRLVVTGATNTSRTLYLSPVGTNETLTSLSLPQLGQVDRGIVWQRVPRTVANATTDPVAIVGLIFLIATFLAAAIWLVDIWRRRRAGKTDDALH
jgi:hypothetical protein